jgi:transcriptional regulator with XRE-family HTH domain
LSQCEERKVRGVVLEWIRQGLAKPGKSQAGLGRSMGVSQSVANRIAKGTRKVTLEDLPRIAEYLEEPLPVLGPTALSTRRMPATGVRTEEANVLPCFEDAASALLVEIAGVVLEHQLRLEDTLLSSLPEDLRQLLLEAVRLAWGAKSTAQAEKNRSVKL